MKVQPEPMHSHQQLVMPTGLQLRLSAVAAQEPALLSACW